MDLVRAINENAMLVHAAAIRSKLTDTPLLTLLSMTEEGQPVDPNEHVLRRVHDSSYHVGAPIPFDRGAFTPNSEDDDGLSFYLEREVTPAQLKQSARKPPNEYVIVRLSVRDLNRLGLRLVFKKSEDLPGHCVAPDFNYRAYRNKVEKTAKWVPIQEKLRRLAELIE